MVIKKEDIYEFKISPKQIKDIEKHSKKVSEDAVIDLFIMFFAVPKKLICRLISARKSKQVDKVQAASH